MLELLVRNFKENGIKLLLEHGANVRDLLNMVGGAAAADMDFTHMTVERTHFIKRGYRHLLGDMLVRLPLRVRTGTKSIFVYILIEHQSDPDRFIMLRTAEYLVEVYAWQKRAWENKHSSTTGLLLQPVIPVVFYTGTEHWKNIATLTELVQEGSRFEPVIPHIRPHYLNLPDLAVETLTGCTEPVPPANVESVTGATHSSRKAFICRTNEDRMRPGRQNH